MGLMKSYYTAIHGRGGRKSKLRKDAAKAEASIERDIRRMLATEQQWRDWQWESAQRQWRACRACTLRSGADQVVLGRGALQPLVFVVAAEPTDVDDQEGEAMSEEGLRGLLFARAAEKVGLNLERDVWRTHIVGCCPSTGRGKAKADHKEACRNRLIAELAITQPYVLLLLGKVPLTTVCVGVSSSARISDFLGVVPKEHWPHGALGLCGTANLKAVLATYDMGYVLRKRNTPDHGLVTRQLGSDLRKVKLITDKLNKKLGRT